MNGWLKVLAVSSALTLGGGYVWISQRKSANLPEEIESRSGLPGSKSKVVVDEPQPFDGKFPPFDDVKDATPPANPRTNADFIAPSSEPKKERTVLPSSKIGLVTPPEAEDDKPKSRTVLPGSKSFSGIVEPQSIDRILESPKTEKEKDKEEP